MTIRCRMRSDSRNRESAEGKTENRWVTSVQLAATASKSGPASDIRQTSRQSALEPQTEMALGRVQRLASPQSIPCAAGRRRVYRQSDRRRVVVVHYFVWIYFTHDRYARASASADFA